MSQIRYARGTDTTLRYDAIASRFRPVFKRIRANAAERDVHRILPNQEVAWLKEVRFGALRLPTSANGAAVTLPELFDLLIELSAADSNVTQIFRAHFGLVEDILNGSEQLRALWFERLGRGDVVGGAWTEIGNAKQDRFATTITRNAPGWRLNGKKFYTTGSLFADWIDVGASDETGQSIGVFIPRHSAGVDIADDWDGFGQSLTASGTAIFTDVDVAPSDILDDSDRAPYTAAFAQLVHLATLAGIAQAASEEVAREVGARRRSFSNAAGSRPSTDPQILQIVGRVHSASYASRAIVIQAAGALQRVYDARDTADTDELIELNATAEIETSQAQSIVIDLVLRATADIFDALGASSVRRGAALDRLWRNARTIASHNPRAYKERIVGDFAVNGTPPSNQWRIGIAPEQVAPPQD